jgi:hypothetical protein
VRNITAFLNLDAGLIHGEAPDPNSVRPWAEAQAEELRQARVQLEKHRKQLERSREGLPQRDRRISLLEERLSANGSGPQRAA